MKSLGGFVTAWCKIKGNCVGWGGKMSLVLVGKRWKRNCLVLRVPETPDP